MGITKNDHDHYAKVVALGCIVCRREGLGESPALIHHLTGIKYRGAGKKASSAHVIPLCPYHHQGGGGIHTIGMRPWESLHGTQADLLADVERLVVTQNW